jgi:hypothetical protein
MITIYILYKIDSDGNTKFVGRFGSKHRLHNAAIGLGLTNWFYETEEKVDKYDGINLTQAVKN